MRGPAQRWHGELTSIHSAFQRKDLSLRQGGVRRDLDAVP